MILNPKIFLKKYLPVKVKNKIKALQSSFLFRKVSYSQCGEDLIIRHIFDALKIPHPIYLDIGAHHPAYLSNTLIFYQNGSTGVNIEPDPQLFTHIKKCRSRDTNLNIGISDQKDTLDFYVMTVPTLNTFSQEEAKKSESEKVKIDNIIKIPVMPVDEILREYFADVAPDFLSLDVEGLDLKILQSFNFAKWKPKVICVETITYSENRDGKKIKEIEIFLIEKGYFPYADTHINTIFVDKAIW